MVLGIILVILAMFLVLLFLSRNEQGKLFHRMGYYLFKFSCKHKLPLVEDRQVKTDLERLYPGMSKRDTQMDYYVEKFSLLLMVLLAGTLLTFLIWIRNGIGSAGVTNSIERSPVGEGEQEILLSATKGDEKAEITIQVSERQLTEEERNRLFEECVKELEVLIPGENSSLKSVEKDLVLPEYVEGYPFDIMWKSSDSSLINTRGELGNVLGRRGEKVCLTAVLCYENYRYEQNFWGEIGEVKEEDEFRNKLMKAIQEKDSSAKYDDKVVLPEELEGEKIIWREVTEDNAPLFLGLTILVTVAVFFLKDKDLHELVRERNRSLRLAYPTILNKFVLYMGAGMTVRGSFLKIAGDYQKDVGKNKVNPAYEEMLFSCNELHAGVSEGLVYEHFGNRSGLREYARLATMLGQNLKKGNTTLLKRLQEESEKAMQEDLQFRKKIGEEAETKLLIPMVMMLGIVMLLVMLPAFSSLE